jgi:hypothetical protein
VSAQPLLLTAGTIDHVVHSVKSLAKDRLWRTIAQLERDRGSPRGSLVERLVESADPPAHLRDLQLLYRKIPGQGNCALEAGAFAAFRAGCAAATAPDKLGMRNTTDAELLLAGLKLRRQFIDWVIAYSLNLVLQDLRHLPTMLHYFERSALLIAGGISRRPGQVPLRCLRASLPLCR